VTSVAEKHYGVTGMSHFDETRDRGQKKVWDEYDEIHRADVMSWYIHKNDDLQRDQKVDVPFYSQVPFSADDCDYQASYKLMMCGADLAPTHPNSSKYEPLRHQGHA
jgi:hypothetical protein